MKYFTIEEFFDSTIAQQQEIYNRPPSSEVEKVVRNIETLVREVLDPLREYIKVPIKISSGYRCRTLNMLVRGVETSQHRKGQAADIYPLCTNKRHCLSLMYAWLAKYIDFDQLIYYKGRNFIHISFVSEEKNRHEIIIKR